jgi:hypothetical protein
MKQTKKIRECNASFFVLVNGVVCFSYINQKMRDDDEEKKRRNKKLRDDDDDWRKTLIAKTEHRTT